MNRGHPRPYPIQQRRTRRPKPPWSTKIVCDSNGLDVKSLCDPTASHSAPPGVTRRSWATGLPRAMARTDHPAGEHPSEARAGGTECSIRRGALETRCPWDRERDHPRQDELRAKGEEQRVATACQTEVTTRSRVPKLSPRLREEITSNIEVSVFRPNAPISRCGDRAPVIELSPHDHVYCHSHRLCLESTRHQGEEFHGHQVQARAPPNRQ